MGTGKMGRVVWITGLSATGKSTIARFLKNELDSSGHPAVIVDGDEVREMVADDCCGHDRGSRIKNAYRICRLARMIARQGFTVLVATMSLYHEVHAWNRLHLPGYIEVFIEADIETLRKRDPKGLYAKLENGEERNLGGVDIAAEFPEKPDLHIRNNGGPDDIPKVAGQILGLL
ncbi:adenylyl-sulfate kinase [Pseudodesulfovibrio sp.]|uniref:adenylyl-sulfate kinase n=1 Tax=unclassified Pseudodesulfovibrio TaxID=2661612 RepID=UPI003B009C4E